MLKALASLKFTVVLFAMSVFIVFAGTLAQVDKGIWTVVDDYFRCAWAWIDFQLFFPRAWNVPGGFYFPGGWLIGVGLMLNLLSAHTIRFKINAKGGRLTAGVAVLIAGCILTWLIINGTFNSDVAATEDDAFYRVLFRLCKGGIAAIVLYIACHLLFAKRAGIVLLHGGIMLLLISELYTGMYAIESNMSIEEGKTVNFIDRSLQLELAIIDESNEEYDDVVVIPDSKLVEGEKIQHKELPFDIKVEKYMINSTFPIEIKNGIGPEKNLATAGDGLQYYVKERSEGTGVSTDQSKDTASAYISFYNKKDNTLIGTYLLSLWFYVNHGRIDLPQKIKLDDKEYTLYLRYEREFLVSEDGRKPFSIKLNEFHHDTYIGTNIPSNFASDVTLVDSDRDVTREVKIWMNNPLRYAGLTFYQSGVLPNDSGTILQVVRNASWMIPYLSCMIVGMGLLGHFMINFISFMKKR